MNNQEHWVKICAIFRVTEHNNFTIMGFLKIWLDLPLESFHVDKDDNIEEKSDENKENAGENPDGKGG